MFIWLKQAVFGLYKPNTRYYIVAQNLAQPVAYATLFNMIISRLSQIDATEDENAIQQNHLKKRCLIMRRAPTHLYSYQKCGYGT
mgnify:CR=1 FL=1